MITAVLPTLHPRNAGTRGAFTKESRTLLETKFRENNFELAISVGTKKKPTDDASSLAGAQGGADVS
jgi:hypothetical protein